MPDADAVREVIPSEPLSCTLDTRPRRIIAAITINAVLMFIIFLPGNIPKGYRKNIILF
jgi:hypothetical protein